jgi:ferredoxin-NADP reductase
MLHSCPTFLRPQEQPHTFSFLPGQWVDLRCPAGLGGYTICSAPAALHAQAPAHEQGSFELAVKRSSHPVAAWVHAAQLGGQVHVRVGGQFVLLPEHLCPRINSTGQHSARLLFIAGGIGRRAAQSEQSWHSWGTSPAGVTPLLSMLRHLTNTLSFNETATLHAPRVRFLYIGETYPCARGTDTAAEWSCWPQLTTCWPAVRTLAQAALLPQLLACRAAWPPGQLAVEVYVTQHEPAAGTDTDSAAQQLEGCLKLGRPSPTELATPADHVFVCGPPSLAEQVVQARAQAKDVGQVHCERWW